MRVACATRLAHARAVSRTPSYAALLAVSAAVAFSPMSVVVEIVEAGIS